MKKNLLERDVLEVTKELISSQSEKRGEVLSEDESMKLAKWVNETMTGVSLLNLTIEGLVNVSFENDEPQFSKNDLGEYEVHKAVNQVH